jgi:putative transposase
MLDDDIVAVSPTSVYRALKAADQLDRKWVYTVRKGTGFVQPLKPHQHWHINVFYINVEGTFYYLTSILDGYSRFVVHWELRESMTELDVEVIVQKALDKYLSVKPGIISDNRPQFIAHDFQQFIRLVGITHFRTRPYYPQRNGKLERWHGSLKRECIRPVCPSAVDEARRRITLTSPATTPFDCIPRSDTLPQPANCKAWNR